MYEWAVIITRNSRTSADSISNFKRISIFVWYDFNFNIWIFQELQTEIDDLSLKNSELRKENNKVRLNSNIFLYISRVILVVLIQIDFDVY